MALRKTSLLLSLLILLSSATFSQKAAKISKKDFKNLIGYWTGSLTYLDYSSGKPFTLPADVEIRQLSTKNQFEFIHIYPDEPKANGSVTVTLSEDGTLLGNQQVVSNRKLKNGDREIITEIMGTDGNDDKPALMRYTTIFGKESYINRKDVQFVGEESWIMRNESKYQRKK